MQNAGCSEPLMPTLETLNDPAGPHIHEAVPHADETQCPYCGQPITRKEFKEIQVRIESEGRERVAKVEQALKDRFARERKQAEATGKVAVEQAKKEAVQLAERQIKTLKANQEAVIAARLKTQREASREEADGSRQFRASETFRREAEDGRTASANAASASEENRQ